MYATFEPQGFYGAGRQAAGMASWEDRLCKAILFGMGAVVALLIGMVI